MGGYSATAPEEIELADSSNGQLSRSLQELREGSERTSP